MVLLVSWPGWLETAELKLYDWRMRTVADIRIARKMPLVNPDIVLVEITDAAIRDLSELVGRWPWPRTVHGTLIDYISSGKPKAIAVDLTLLEQERESTYKFGDGQMTSVESDKALADSVKNAGNVIMLADAVDPASTTATRPSRSRGRHRHTALVQPSKNAQSSRCRTPRSPHPPACWRRTSW